MSYRIGVDTGGTFTDVALVHEESGKIYVTKVPSTPHNPSLAVIDGTKQIIKENNLSFEDVGFFIHGSTVATNTLLEQKGANTALLTTKGFKDVLQIGRQTRPKLYDFRARKNNPLVPRNLRLELDERISFQGDVLKEVNEKEVYEIIEVLKEHRIESLAICFINSYVNSEHEKLVKEIIEKELPHLSLTLSSEVLPEFKEYERTSTVVANAYVLPKMKYYINHLKDNLKDLKISSNLYIMQSNGGIISAEAAMETPAKTVLSGPAGGTLAGSIIAKNTEYKNLITIDMGGTSLDTALIENGQPQFTTMSNIEGHPIKLPMIEMHTIGSGGGSIAWIDPGGALRVGPHSAGARPGPVCYGHGGTEPTVSDANVILGRLNPNSILGGRMKMDVEAARKVMKEKIADPLNLTVEEAAEGILRVVNANMVRGIRVISIEKGHDPRDFALVAFGGAGPVHAVDIAEQLGCSNVIIPPNPGITCAMGMLMADVRHDYVRTLSNRSSEFHLDKLNRIYEELSKEAYKELLTEGFSQGTAEVQGSIDIRYKKQAYEINVPVSSLQVTSSVLLEAIESFHQAHEKIYGFSRRDEEIEIINLRVVGIGKIKELKIEGLETAVCDDLKEIDTRLAYFNSRYEETPIYRRADISVQHQVQGPAIIEQLDSTIVIPPHYQAKVDQDGNFIISKVESVSKKGEEVYERNAY